MCLRCLPEHKNWRGSPLCPQAFQMGRTFVTQFHPEVTESIVTRWSMGDGAAAELATVTSTVEELRCDTSRYVLNSGREAARLVDWYLEQVSTCKQDVRSVFAALEIVINHRR